MPMDIAPLAVFLRFEPRVPIVPEKPLPRLESLHLGAFLCKWRFVFGTSRTYRCQQSLSGYNREQYNDWCPVVPAHTTKRGVRSPSHEQSG
jgi:hypothetical protein